MRSKAEIIRSELKGLRVLDIGGVGYGEDNPYERELADAWKVCKSRTTIDGSDKADIQVNFNGALPNLDPKDYDVAVAFGIMEHVERPAELLRWIPIKKLVVNFPNGTSWLSRRMEEKNKSKHLYSFTPYTASILLSEGNWGTNHFEYTFGKWSLVSQMINVVGSLCPKSIATDFCYWCDRDAQKQKWKYV